MASGLSVDISLGCVELSVG